jgi:hypothetical protein
MTSMPTFDLDRFAPDFGEALSEGDPIDSLIFLVDADGDDPEFDPYTLEAV